MSIVLSFGSIILGLLSWWIPLKAMGLEGKEKKALKYSVMSFSACVLVVLAAVTIVLNVVAFKAWKSK